MLKSILMSLALCGTVSSYAQTQFWSDTFEDAGAPSSGTRTPSAEFLCGGPPAIAYFARTTPASLALQGGAYTNYQGSKIWAGEDLDKGVTCANGSVPPIQTITWSGINISGKSGLSFRGLFAAFNGIPASSSITNWEGRNTFPADYDMMEVAYSIDGGPYVNIIGIYSNRDPNGAMMLDTDNDGFGDANLLTTAFQEFTASIPATGNSLSLRFSAKSNNLTVEELAIDNFRLFETATCVPPTITAQPANRIICNLNNTTYSVAATGATAYQWQLNSGSGFSNISNNSVYSGANSSTLTVTNANSSMSGYQYRCMVMNGGAGCFTNSSSASLTISLPATPVFSQTNITCYGSNTGAASVTPSGGFAPYTYNWTPMGGTASSATALAAGSYTVTVTDNIGCNTQRDFTIIQPVRSPGADSYSVPTVARSVVQQANTYHYVSGSCELVAAVYGSGASPVSGNISSRVWIESSVPTFSNTPFVQRHYEVTPSTNAATATGTVTLYFTQAEFDAFNAHPASNLDLPTGPSDAIGKSHLRIGKYSGTTGNGTGLPASYTGSTSVIDPADSDIVWNANSNTWEVSFTVSGFSGFIVQTSTFTLPVSWASFTVTPNGRQAQLNWSTASEQNASQFAVQHSTDGRNWQQLAILPATGNSQTERHYSYIHPTPADGINYYRIEQQDIDGSKNYSRVEMLQIAQEKAAVKLLSNPVQGHSLQVNVTGGMQNITLLNAVGQVLLQKTLAPGYHKIPVNSLSAGIYFFVANGETTRILIE